MAKITQRERVLQYMEQYGSITRLQAAMDLGCFELASRIGELEDMSYRFNKETVTSKNRYGDTVHYKKYSIFSRPK